MKKFVFGMVAFALIGACETGTTGGGLVDAMNPVAQEAGRLVLSEQQTAMCSAAELQSTALCKGFDLGAKFLQESSTADEIDYTADDAFDTALYKSMKGNVPQIEIKFDGNTPSYTSLTQVMERPVLGSGQLVLWQAKVLNTGGHVVVCEASANEGLTDALLGIVVNRAFEYFDNVITYRPAAEYNSVLVVSPEVDGDREVEEFFYRLRTDERGTDCFDGTVKVSDLSRPKD